ncbi:MAG TPA: thiolase family protein [Planctomycetota bacterium]|jgi:acetyl-CoA C-acetyltransferase|nr:thiolase family protein [Planctomycetota bacterium]
MGSYPSSGGPRIVVTHAVRTPIGKFLGSFSPLSSADLGASAVSALLRRANLPPERVDRLVFGNARQAGGGPNVARQIALRAGCPATTRAFTVNMACASGLKSLALAYASVALGESTIVVAGGTESMTNLPFLLPGLRSGYRLGDRPVLDAMFQDGFRDPICGLLMGETAEKLARERGIPREEQDAYAAESQARCARARSAGLFAQEIAPVEVGERGGRRLVEEDEHPREGVTLESLAKLPPVFDPEKGTVTAGNSSGITDGAAALLVTTLEEAKRLGFSPLARLGPSAEAGVDPSIMGIGPVPAVRDLCDRMGVTPESFDLIELNEAFAAQVLACARDLELPRERLNVNGGAIALGHPIGCSGARIVVTLLHEMRRREAWKGLATLCVSGGMGLAASFFRFDR